MAIPMVQFKKGEFSGYSGLTKDVNTIYFCTDTQQLFVGETEYTRPVLSGTTDPTTTSGKHNPPRTLYLNTSSGTLFVTLDDGTWSKVGAGSTEFTELSTLINNHIADKNNPHNVDKTDVGLGNVDNVKQIAGLSSGTTKDHIVAFSDNGYTVKDTGKKVSELENKIDSISGSGAIDATTTNKATTVSLKIDTTASGNVTLSQGDNGLKAQFTETSVSVTQGTAPADDSATPLNHGGYFNVVSDVKKGTGTHEVVETLEKFKLPDETAISVDTPAATSGGNLNHGDNITVVTGVTKGDSSHNIDVTTKTFKLPSEKIGSGSVTGDKTTFVKSVILRDHVLDGDTQDADATITDASDGIPTSAAVRQYVNDRFSANDAMVFKGTLGTGGTTTTLPTSGYSAGWTYRVVAEGTYAGVDCEIGDLVIAIKDGPASGSTQTNANWTVAQTNIDGALTKSGIYKNGYVLVAYGTSGSVAAGTEAQTKAINSGITEEIVQDYQNHKEDGTIHITSDDRTTWNGKQDSLDFISIPSKENPVATEKDLPDVMTGASESAAGQAGLVPAPGAGKQASFLRGDGTWVVPTDTDTHHQAKLVVASSADATENGTGAAAFINLVENGEVRSSTWIRGANNGGIVVGVTDGQIEILSPNLRWGEF